jgi:hypothetical protein
MTAEQTAVRFWLLFRKRQDLTYKDNFLRERINRRLVTRLPYPLPLLALWLPRRISLKARDEFSPVLVPSLPLSHAQKRRRAIMH